MEEKSAKAPALWIVLNVGLTRHPRWKLFDRRLRGVVRAEAGVALLLTIRGPLGGRVR